MKELYQSKMNEDIKIQVIRNSLIFYILRDSMPFGGDTYKEFESWELEIISCIKEHLDKIDLGIEAMRAKKEKEDQKIMEEIIRSLNFGFQDILRQKYRELNIRRIPNKLRNEILRRDGYKCQYCGADLKESKDNIYPAQIDHIKSWRSGGKTNPENLLASCWRCNVGKKDYDIFEYEDDQTENKDGETNGSISGKK